MTLTKTHLLPKKDGFGTKQESRGNFLSRGNVGLRNHEKTSGAEWFSKTNCLLITFFQAKSQYFVLEVLGPSLQRGQHLYMAYFMFLWILQPRSKHLQTRKIAGVDIDCD